jgi:hypothetical protein
VHVLVGGIGDRVVEDHRIHTRFGLDEIDDFVGEPGLGDAFVSADEGLFASQSFDLVSQFLV